MFYAKEIKHPSMSSRGGGAYFFYTLMRTGLAYRHNDMEYQRITLYMRKCVPLTPFTGKPACFPLSSQSGWNKVLIWLPHPL